MSYCSPATNTRTKYIWLGYIMDHDKTTLLETKGYSFVKLTHLYCMIDNVKTIEGTIILFLHHKMRNVQQYIGIQWIEKRETNTKYIQVRKKGIRLEIKS